MPAGVLRTRRLYPIIPQGGRSPVRDGTPFSARMGERSHSPRRLEGISWFCQAFLLGSSSLLLAEIFVDSAALHNKIDVLEGAHVGERIGLHGDDVCKFTRLA